MLQTLSRAEELRNDLDNMHFTKRCLIKTLANLELLGKTNTWDFQRTEINLNILNKNIKRVEAELEKAEADEIMDYLYNRFINENDLHHWSND